MKHLVYLIDGTWMFSGDMSANKRFTNIHLLNHYLAYSDRRSRSQVVHYKRGIGSAQEKFRRLTNYAQGLFGLGIWNDVEEIYLNICANFEGGETPDQIYLFGFSRGAAVARAVAELVDIGILQTEKIDNVADGLKIYRDRYRLRSALRSPSKEDKGALEELHERESKFRAHCHSGRREVTFLGLFDTVIGGIHISKAMQELNMLDSRPSNSVKHCLQLLAIDETRNMFRPSVFTSMNNHPDATLEQIWMPGIHSNIGGGLMNDNLSLISLVSMIDRVMHHTELKFRVDDLKKLLDRENVETSVENEWSPVWRFLCGIHRLNAGGKRTPKGVNSKIHVAADLMSRDNITYKDRPRRQHYDSGAFSKLDQAPLFLSEEFSGQIIRI